MKLLQRQQTKSGLFWPKQNKMTAMSLRDTILVLERQITNQFDQLDRLNIISYETHVIELGFQCSFTATVTETNKIKPIEKSQSCHLLSRIKTSLRCCGEDFVKESKKHNLLSKTRDQQNLSNSCQQYIFQIIFPQLT